MTANTWSSQHVVVTLVLDLDMAKQLKLFEVGIKSDAANETGKSGKGRKQSQASYESAKRSRVFVKSWEEKYPGIFEGDAGKLYCKPCTEFPTISDPKSSLVLGTSSYRTSSLEGHWQSKQHLLAASRFCEVERERQGQPIQGPMDRALRALSESNKNIMLKLFNTVYFILKYEEPFTALPRLLSLQIKNGSELGKLLSYRSDQACRRLCKVIADDIREPLIESVRSADAISLMFDGATDASITEVEIVYVRYVENGLPVTTYLSLQSVAHAHAQGVFDAIEKAFDDNGIHNWRDKVVGVGCDGASVNIGKNNSVATRILDDHDHILIIHCMAHRLELGVLGAIKNSRLLDEVKDVLKKIYKHYHYSPKALREVRGIAEAMDGRLLKPSKVEGTRWTPHMERALKILTTSYPAIQAHFEHVSQAGPGQATAEVKGRAVFLTRKLKDMRLLRFMHFMLDLLKVVSSLSLSLQRDDINVNSMLDALETTNLELVALSQAPGEHLTEFTNSLQNDPQNPTGKMYKDVKLTHSGDVADDQTYPDVIETVQDHITNRLENERDRATGIMKTARIFDVNEWPHDQQQLAVYGNNKVTDLYNHFQPVISQVQPAVTLNNVQQEWTQLKAHILNANWPEVSSCFRHGFQNRFRNVLKLYEMVVALPVSSAVCERGFSCLGRIKSDWRSQLTTEQLDRLMLISIAGPSFDTYTAERALDKWWNHAQRSRRPVFDDEHGLADREVLDCLFHAEDNE